MEDFAFLTPVLPLRGFDYAEQIGTKITMTNMEFRFPLLKYLVFGALPIGFSNILGTAFLDMGSAWSDTRTWRAFGSDPNDGSAGNEGSPYRNRCRDAALPLRLAYPLDLHGDSEEEVSLNRFIFRPWP